MVARTIFCALSCFVAGKRRKTCVGRQFLSKSDSRRVTGPRSNSASLVTVVLVGFSFPDLLCDRIIGGVKGTPKPAAPSPGGLPAGPGRPDSGSGWSEVFGGPWGEGAVGPRAAVASRADSGPGLGWRAPFSPARGALARSQQRCLRGPAGRHVEACGVCGGSSQAGSMWGLPWQLP